MRLETFFEKFELFADAPGAVAKMRALVRHLAVQGRIVTQSPADEPADVLAAAISEDREAFVNARSLARQRIFDPVTEDQRPFELPAGWAWTRLGNLCRVQAGFAFESSAFVQGDSGIPMIRIRDITSDRTQVNFVGAFRDEFLVDAGDYLVGMDGNFTVAKWRGPRALLNQRVSRLQWYSTRLESSFFAISAQHRFSDLQGKKAYTTVDHLSSKQIEEAVVPLPPLAEQKRIVAKVDALMALCDRLEAQQQERQTRHTALACASLSRFAEAPTPANLDFLFHDAYAIDPADLRKSILTLAVQGKLVPQESKPCIAILGSILSEPSANGVSKGPTLDTGATEILRISAGTSRSDFHVNEDDFKHVDLAVSEVDKNRLRSGDLLACRFNGNLHYVGRFSHYRGESGRIQVNPDKLIRFRVDTKLYSPRYVCFAMNAAPTREAIEAMCATTAGNIGLSAGRLKTVEIPMPSLAVQQRIVAKVDQLMGLVDQLEGQMAAANVAGAALLDAAIHEVLNPSDISPLSLRIATGCHVIQQMANKNFFGRTTCAKVLYLAEAHIGLQLGWRPQRKAAGPLDTWIYQFEEQAKAEQWFETLESKLAGGKTKLTYRPGPALPAQAALARQWTTPSQQAELDRLLGLLADKTTEEAEIIATLFAAWNDALIDGLTPSDDDIICEVRDNWHERKQRFAPSQLQRWLKWLRSNQLVPRGHPPRTKHQESYLSI